MNRVTLLGNLTRDIELRKTPTDKSVCQFTIAVNERYGAEFIDCRAWEKTAETLERYVGKGSKLLVEGRIKTDTFEGRNGMVRRTFVEVSNFEFVDSKPRSDTQNVMVTNDIPAEGISRREDPSHIYTPDIGEDDLPFI